MEVSSLAAAPIPVAWTPEETQPFVPVEVYLHTAYSPDRDYVDGQVVERYVGEKPHSRVQRFLTLYLDRYSQGRDLELLPEQRVQVSERRYRVPDLCLVAANSEDELIVRTPPLLCVEILSREDRVIQMNERLQDYRRMGVSAVWVIDPWAQEAFTFEGDGDWRRVHDALLLPALGVRLPLAELFAALKPRDPQI